MTKPTRVLPPSEERRHFRRYQIDPEKRAHVVAHLLDTERCPAHVLDLSKVGICLLCNRRVNPGDVVAVSLHHILRQFACEVPVRVVFAAECQEIFLLGGAFTRQLTHEEMAGLL